MNGRIAISSPCFALIAMDAGTLVLGVRFGKTRQVPPAAKGHKALWIPLLLATGKVLRPQPKFIAPAASIDGDQRGHCLFAAGGRFPLAPSRGCRTGR